MDYVYKRKEYIGSMCHDWNCNCEDCWWANDQREICGICGSLVGAGCPTHSCVKEKEGD